MSVQLVLFDDARAAAWQPFALTRPAGELLHGVFTPRARAERIFNATFAGHLSTAALAGFNEDGARTISLDSIAVDEPRLFLSSRAVLDWAARDARLQNGAVAVGDELAGWYAAAGEPNPDVAFLQNPGTTSHAGRGTLLPGHMLQNVWDLVTENARQIIADYDAFRTHDSVSAVERGGQFAALNFTAGDLRLGAGVTIEPNVVLDFSHGPIWLDDGVTIRSFTRLTGPAYVGRDSTLLGGPYDAVSVGPVCRVHGELEESVVLGYSNKAHDGFIGHAYLGRWVNLGAMTTNSDLKNNYGNVRMWTPNGDVDTGTMKLGCLIGDHVKTGIGSLINTGTVIGAGSNLFGTDMPPKYVPPFSWGCGDDLTTYDVDKFMATASTAMGRRKIELSPEMNALLRRAWESAHP